MSTVSGVFYEEQPQAQPQMASIGNKMSVKQKGKPVGCSLGFVTKHGLAGNLCSIAGQKKEDCAGS